MRRRVSLPLLTVGVILSIGLFHLSGFLHPVEDAGRFALLPVVRVFATIGQRLGRALAPRRTHVELETRNRELEARFVAQRVDAVRLRALEDENASLRKLAGFLGRSGYDHVAANIIARTMEGRRALFLIDRGARDGLETGMAVVVEDGVFVGKITSLREHVSVVTLVSDTESRIAASVSGRTGLAGLIQGEGNGVARLTLVPQSVRLTPNDMIVTAGTEEKIPPHLAIGLVNHIEGPPTDPFQTASLEPLAPAATLRIVAVLRPSVFRPNS